ncbi:MAG: methyl-accepting chemotaxis protein [Magnetospirillum sp.]
MSNLRIGLRLALLTAILAVLVLVVGGKGLSTTGHLADSLRSVYVDRAVPLVQLSNIQDRLHRMRANAILAASGGSVAEAERLTTDTARLQAEINGMWGQYMAAQLNAEEKALADSLARQLAAYAESRTNTMRLAADGRFADATANMQVDAAVKFAAALGSLDRLQNLQAEIAKSEYQNAQSDYEWALVINLGLMFGGLLLAIGLAVLIVRSVAGGIVAMTAAMEQLAAGKLDITIPALTQRDEIGAMAQALQVFRKNAVDKRQAEQEQHERAEAARVQDEAQRRNEAAIVAEVAALAKAASEGDMERRIETSGMDGFLLTLCQSVNSMVGRTGHALNEVAQVLGALATGDLTKRITGDYDGIFGRLKTDLNQTAAKLSTIVGTIDQATKTITTSASEVAAGSQDLSERSEQQASALEETAASMEELAATVRQNAANAQAADQLAADARQVAANGGQVVTDAIAAMGRIESSSKKIEDIVGMIDEIAFQTNLLALNAAVEAARAGEAGKGFAVVAQEVRNLAQRSAEASKEIKGLIAESSTQVRSGAELVKSAGDTLADILGSVKRVADIVAEIASASGEQASGIDQVNSAVSQMDEMTQQNAALVEESAAAAQSLAHAAEGLEEQMAFFVVDSSSTGGMRHHAALVRSTKIDHDTFCKTVKDAAAGRNALVAAKLSDHHNCRLGTWYDAVKEDKITRSPHFTRLLEPHTKVHAAGKRALACHEQGDAAGCAQAIREMDAASGAVMKVLDQLADDIQAHGGGK